jgi:tripartite-type tricarboxylate transporter receptor subunit TctC
MAPAGTPKAITDRLSVSIREFMQQPETKKKMSELGAVAVAVPPDEFAKYIASETQRWKGVIEKANITMN